MFAADVGVVVTQPVDAGSGFAELATGRTFVCVCAKGGWNESDFAIVANSSVL
jgi:hypothetical protein